MKPIIKNIKKENLKTLLHPPGLTTAVGTLFFLTTFSLGGDFYFGP